MNLQEFLVEVLNVAKDNLDESGDIIVVLPQVGDEIEGEEIATWDADVSYIELKIIDGRKYLRIL